MCLSNVNERPVAFYSCSESARLQRVPSDENQGRAQGKPQSNYELRSTSKDTQPTVILLVIAGVMFFNCDSLARLHNTVT